jgi:hypothetical protein
MNQLDHDEGLKKLDESFAEAKRKSESTLHSEL